MKLSGAFQERRFAGGLELFRRWRCVGSARHAADRRRHPWPRCGPRAV